MGARGLLLVLSGPSGAGKGTLRKALIRRQPGLVYGVSATTRPPRPGERAGVDYYFLTAEEFQRRLAAGDFVESAEVYGSFYGTPRQPMETLLAAGQDVIVEKDVQGARALRQKYPEGVYVFIMPPSYRELCHRITERGTDSPEMVRQRLGEARKELQWASSYDYVVVNDCLDEAVARLEAIMMAEKCRPVRLGFPRDLTGQAQVTGFGEGERGEG